MGVFGGTFDPVHLAHLVLAEQAREQAALDRVLFVPAARPPHKLGRPLTPFQRRLEMLELAIAGYPAFQVSTVEDERQGPSFTADTLEELKRREPGSEFFLVVGSDCLPDLPYWHQPERVAALAELLVAARPGTESSPVPSPFRARFIVTPLLEISSTDLRRRLQEGRSVRYLVPRAVECYILTHGLYK